MLEKIGEKVSVNFIYDHLTGKVAPRFLKWKNQLYRIQKVGLHYTLYRGTELIHMFSVADDDRYFLLSLNTKTLTWILEEVADNTTN